MNHELTEAYKASNFKGTYTEYLEALIADRLQPAETEHEVIKRIVLEYFIIPETWVTERQEKKLGIVYKHMYVYALDRYSNTSMNDKAFSAGFKNHSSVHYAIKCVNNQRDTDKVYRVRLAKFERYLHLRLCLCAVKNS